MELNLLLRRSSVWVLLLSAIPIIIIYLIDDSKSNWVAGPVMLIINIIFLLIQSVLCFAIFNTKNKIYIFILFVLYTLIFLFLLILLFRYLFYVT